jgi:hypothetical protein
MIECGLLKVSDGKISWMCDKDTIWSMSIEDLAIAGEFFDDDGISIAPENHRIVLVQRTAIAFDFPAGVEGLSFAERDIQAVYEGFEFDLKCWSTEPCNRIFWPHCLRDVPLTELVRSVPRTMMERVWSWAGWSYERRLSEQAKNYLKSLN